MFELGSTGSGRISELQFPQTTTLFGSLSGSGKWVGGVLAPNGKIYGIPRDSTQVLEIDPGAGLPNPFAETSSFLNKF